MKENVTLKELFAFVIRKGRAVIVMALVCALVLGGVMAVLQLRDNTEEQRASYLEELEEYRLARARLQDDIAVYERRLEMQEVHNDNSLLMQIDPCNTYKATVCLAISDVDDKLLNQFTSMDYLVGRIVNQYINYWNGLVLGEALENNPYSDSEEKYIRELMDLQSADGGVLNLTIVASGEAEAAVLAESAWQCLQNARELVVEGSFEHKVVLLSKTTKLVADDTLAAKQQINTGSVEAYKTKIADTKKQLKSLVEPEFPSVLSSAVKGLILGLAVGIVLAIAWAVGIYFFRGRVETSRELEQGLKLDFLGSAAQKKGVFHRLADGILKERTWSEPAQAMRYIQENVRIRCEKVGSIALVTTLRDEEKNAAVKAVAEALTADGWHVSCVWDLGHNAQAGSVIAGCEQVLLAERAGQSGWEQVVDALELSKRLDKEPCGFVMV